jgi:hypothetical protein
METRSWFSFPLFDTSGWKSPTQHLHIYPSFWSRSLLYMALPCIPIPEPLPWFVCLLLAINSLTPLATGGYNVSPFLSCLVETHNSTPPTSARVCLQPFHPHLFQLWFRNGAPAPSVTLLRATCYRCFRIRWGSPVFLLAGLHVVPTMEHARVGLGSKGDC